MATVLLRLPHAERVASLLGVTIGWPVAYVIVVGMCWGTAKLVKSANQSWIYGPAKELQLNFLQGPMIWWINAVVVLFPLVVLLGAIVVLFGATLS